MYPVHDRSLGLDSFQREVGGTNLLRDTSSFAFLDIGLTNLIFLSEKKLFLSM